MNEVTKVFLRQHCACGGKIYRRLLRGEQPQDDQGNSYLCTQVQDYCDQCRFASQQTEIVPWPLNDLDKLFSQFSSFELDQLEFNNQVLQILQRAGGSWQRNTC